MRLVKCEAVLFQEHALGDTAHTVINAPCGFSFCYYEKQNLSKFLCFWAQACMRLQCKPIINNKTLNLILLKFTGKNNMIKLLSYKEEIKENSTK